MKLFPSAEINNSLSPIILMEELINHTIQETTNCKKVGEILTEYNNSHQNYTYEQLEALTGISSGTICKYFNDSITQQKRKLIALCIAMSIPNQLSCILLARAGYSLETPNIEDALFKIFLFCVCSSDVTVESCNLLLTKHKCKPLVWTEDFILYLLIYTKFIFLSKNQWKIFRQTKFFAYFLFFYS